MDDPTESEMERLSLREFEQNANFTALAGLSDWCVENGRPHFGACLKEVAAAATPAAHWFFVRHGELMAQSGKPIGTSLRAALRQSVQWAFAEAWAKRQAELDRLRFGWDYDPDDDGVFELFLQVQPPGPPVERRRAWRCVAQRLMRASHAEPSNYWDETAELGPLDLGCEAHFKYGHRWRPTDKATGKDIDRVRFVEAELAARVMREENVPFPAWMLPEPPKPVPKIEPRVPTIVFRWSYETDVVFGLIPELPAEGPDSFGDRCLCYRLNQRGELLETAADYTAALRDSHYCSAMNYSALWGAIEKSGRKVRPMSCAPRGYRDLFKANRAAWKYGS